MLLVWDPLLLFVQTPIEHDDFIIWPDIDDILNKFNTCLILIYSNIHGDFQKTTVFRCHVFSLSKRSSLWTRAAPANICLEVTTVLDPVGSSVLWAHGYLRQWMMLKSQDFYLATVKKTRVKKTWTIWRFICSKNGGKMVQFSNNGRWFFNGHNGCLGCQDLAVSLAVRKQTCSPKNEPK